ncbi:hypothetical protein [Lysinibacillus sp. 54212]|uniref:hypothetical protein n=1 Tax=Lysinibacillus sp. 54212 TaxID=3119829 RepID=UPI002FCB4C5C
MKLEIGESLITSWLKHIKKCQVVQANWKPSIASWELENLQEIERVVGFASDYFQKEYKIALFKNSASILQTIRQAEIDVLGIELQQGQLQKMYAVDVAFHEGGLSYGNKTDTAARIAKKILRTVICLYGYFQVREGEIIFTSPKVHNSYLEEIRPVLVAIEGILKTFQFNFSVRFIANESFDEEILTPILNHSSNVADTSELFMRSVQLIKLFHPIYDERTVSKSPEKQLPKPRMREQNTIPTVPDRPPTVNAISTEYSGKFSNRPTMKIGELIQTAFPFMLRHGLLSSEDIERLADARYSKQTFDMNFPVLKEVTVTANINQQIMDQQGYVRYYKKGFYEYNGKKFALSSQWYDRMRGKLEKWLRDRGV